jgi:hypothetical protein
MSLLQRIYGLKRLASLSTLPVLCQFIAVHVQPFEQESDHSPRKVTPDRAILDVDGRFPSRIPRMKVRRLVLSVIDGYNDAEEPADDWHERYFSNSGTNKCTSARESDAHE